ncbi:hypothetical protein IAT38_002788 [Cryptococcus sp. DSM 104549]
MISHILSAGFLSSPSRGILHTPETSPLALAQAVFDHPLVVIVQATPLGNQPANLDDLRQLRLFVEHVSDGDGFGEEDGEMVASGMRLGWGEEEGVWQGLLVLDGVHTRQGPGAYRLRATVGMVPPHK